MRLEIKHGLVLNPLGKAVGIVDAIEVDFFGRSLTPTQVRLVAPCPFCHAPRAQLCRRWRGGDRKANHAERIEAARSLVA